MATRSGLLAANRDLELLYFGVDVRILLLQAGQHALGEGVACGQDRQPYDDEQHALQQRQE